MSWRKLLQSLVLPALLLFSQLIFAQDRVITGKVTDSTGNGVAGVTVTAKGTRIATQTAADGSFRIAVPSGVETLVVTSVGFDTQEISVSGTNSVTVSLIGAATSLNEVVVIGYGTRLKKDLTGSVTAISSKDFNKGTYTTPEQLIQGKVAGVQITSNGGAPGSGSTIRIRGGASLNASNDPLIVLDGVPLDNNGISGAANPLSLINPNDIETFNILKDASATAIYGSRASNGVIIITTKKGRKGKAKFNFSSQFSLSTLPDQARVLNADEFRAFVNTHGTAAQKALMGGARTDWQDVIYKNATGTDNNLSLAGALKNIPFRVSVGYYNQDGMLRTGSLKRKSASLNVNPNFFNDRLKVELNLKGSMSNTRFANEGAIGSAANFDPTQFVYSSSNRYGGYFEWLDPTTVTGLRSLAPRNPLGILEQRIDVSEVKRAIGNLKFDLRLSKYLNANVNFGFDRSRGEGTVYVSDSAASSYLRYKDPSDQLHGGIDNRYLQKKANTLIETYLNYVRDLNSINSRLDVMIGYSYQDFTTTVYNAERDDNGELSQGRFEGNTFIADANAPLVFVGKGNGQWTGFFDRTTDGSLVTSPTFPFDKPENRLISQFGRLNYTFKNKYLLTATIRRDGSSRFAEENRWGWFPSAAFAWKIKEEDFVKSSKTISDLKLRLGYGVTGQQDGIGNYTFLANYSTGSTESQYQLGSVYYTVYKPDGYNPNLKWEQTETYNAGIDFGFLSNRITGSLDFYYKKTKDLLNEINQPAGTNFSNKIIANVGNMDNQGVEFTINTQPVRSKNVSWDFGFNATYNKNEITNLTIVDDPNYPGNQFGGISGGTGNTIKINSVGYTRGSFYVYQQVYDADGNPVEDLFVDRNGDGQVTDKDLYQYKASDPKFFLGTYSNVNWKKWNAGFSMRASIGNYIYDNRSSSTGTERNILNPLIYLQNGSADVLSSHFVGGGSRYFLSDYYVTNASFLRMDNIYVGFNAGSVVGKNTNLRINGNVQNVFTVTKYKGVDPEIGSGIDNNFYPRPRVFVLGLNLDF